MPKSPPPNCCTVLLFSAERPPTLLVCGFVLWWVAEFTVCLLLSWALGWAVHRGFRLEPPEPPHYLLRYAGVWLLVLGLLFGSAAFTLLQWFYYSFRRLESTASTASASHPLVA